MTANNGDPPETRLRPNILFVADSPSGGAGVAAQRLYEALTRAGLPIRFLVFQGAGGPIVGWNQPHLEKAGGWSRKVLKAWAVVRDGFDAIARWRRGARRDRFFRHTPDSFEITTIFPGHVRLEDHPWFHWADIVHLHWTSGFLSPKQRWAEKKWVISLHDANPFTAVCHFPAGCTNFENGCRVCPQLAGTRNPAWSGRIFDLKKAGYGTGGHITLHAPSQWIADLASRSILTTNYPAVVLPNLFPTTIFRLLDQTSCRDWLGLPQGRKQALFVAGATGNVRKGFVWFLKLAESLVDSDWDFVIVGSGEVNALPKNCKLLGRLADPRLMAAAYNAADVFLSTATQDNYPSTVAEAQLCGTPVVAFSVGGQEEMVVPGMTAFLAPEVGLQGLLDGLAWVESTVPSRLEVATWAADRWNRESIVQRWVGFYQNLL